MAWPAGRVTVTVQLLIVLVPVLVTRDGWITYPVCHCVCVTSVMEQPPLPPPMTTDATLETAERLPAASLARTSYRTVVAGGGAVSVNDVVVGEPITVKVPPLAPMARSTSYPVTPTLSVEAVHDMGTPLAVTDAVGLVGADGGGVSPVPACVVTGTTLDTADKFPAASLART